MTKRLFAFLLVAVALLGLCSCQFDDDGYLIIPGEDPETRNSLQVESNGFLTLILWNFIVDGATWTSVDTILLVPFAIVAIPIVLIYEIFCAIMALFVVFVMLIISGYFG